MEILVALAIVAILSAIVVPQVFGRIKESRQSALSQTFFGLSQGIAEYKKAVTRYPYRLTLLTQKPVLNALDARDLCVAALNTGHINNWRGPYVSRQLLDGGLPMGDAQIQNQLRKETVGDAQYLLIDATSVDTAIASGLEMEFDGVSTTTPSLSGTIRTTGQVAGTVTLSYSIPISGC